MKYICFLNTQRNPEKSDISFIYLCMGLGVIGAVYFGRS